MRLRRAQHLRLELERSPKGEVVAIDLRRWYRGAWRQVLVWRDDDMLRNFSDCLLLEKPVRIEVLSRPSVRHLAGCRVVYPHELLEPGEELPANVSPDIGFQHCEEGCPVMARTLERGRELARKHGW